MLTITNLCKSFGDKKVLNSLNLSLIKGEIYGLLGSNGSGKTTTIHILCQLLKADSGQILINQKLLSGMSKSLLGVATQENLLYKSLTCEENLDFFARLYGMRGLKKKQSIERSLLAVNMIDHKEKIVSTLSGGLQKRLSLAISMIHHPQLLILDEPTTGLDIESRYQLWELIQGLKQEGMTILLTTHFLDEAEKLCDCIGILDHGSLIQEGSLEELKQLIPAKEVVIVKTSQPELAIKRGEERGFLPRYYGGNLAFLVPELLELKTLLGYFEDVPIDGISRQSIGLEQIYFEVLNNYQNLNKRTINKDHFPSQNRS